MWELLKLERQQHVHDLAAVTRLLDVADLAVAAIGDAGLRDLAGVDGVVALDILRPHDAGDDQLALLVVDADLLLAFDDEIAVRQNLRDDGCDVGLQGFLPRDRALAVGSHGGIRGQQAAGEGGSLSGQEIAAEKRGDAGIFGGAAAALGLVGEVRLVGDVDGDGQQVADLVGALILEERARAVSPERIRIVGNHFRFRHRHLHRLVAGLRRRVFDRRKLGLLADLGKAIDAGTAAGKADDAQHGSGKRDTFEPGNQHLLYSAFEVVCALLRLATETGASVSAAPIEEVVSAAGASRGMAMAMATWSRPTTMPEMVRLDCRFSTVTVSPSVPLSTAFPREVR